MSFFRAKPPDKLNICLVTKKFPYPGRGEDDNYLWPIARGIVKLGHKLTILAWQNPRGKTEYISENVRVYFLGELINNPTRKHFATQAFRKFIELQEQNPFHIVHSLDESGLLIGNNRKRFGIA